MSIDSGRDDGPLSGWVICQAHGVTLIGRGVGAALAPVYELRPIMGQQGFGHMALPVWLLGIREFAIPPGAIVERIESFSRPQREHLAVAVERAEQLQAQMSAAESGIVIAPAGTKLPPMAVR